jgi:3-oxoadipate enol-lactonase
MSAVAVDHVVTGRGDGPVVVLSKSLGSTYGMWDAQVAALEERFRVVRYDTCGHCGSPVPDGPYTIDDLADDLVALLDRLALLCTGAQLPPTSSWTDRAATVRAGGSVAVVKTVVERWFTPEHLVAHPDVREAHEAMVAATPAEGYAGCCGAIAALDLRGDLASITAPTLAIAGADDPATPPDKLEGIAAGLPDARLLVVPRAAHLANAERPEIITPVLIEHLEKS